MKREALESFDNRWDEIGNLLSEKRQEKRLSLEDIAKRTCIRLCYLQYIEKGTFDRLPPYPYGFGFIKKYAQCVGADLSQHLNFSMVEEELYPELTLPLSKSSGILKVSLILSIVSLILWGISNIIWL